MILPIYLDPQSILREETDLVPEEEYSSEKFQQLLKDMYTTMQNADGIGLAAPQVGIKKRFTVIDLAVTEHKKKGFLALINPKIVRKSFSKNVMEEGCLSVPGIYGTVKRPKEVTIEYIDQNGAQQKQKTEGLLARVIQHEIDHLDGILFTDKVIEYSHEKRFKPSYPFVE